MSDQLDIGELRALEAKATPAPWAAWEKEHTRGDVVIGVTWNVVCNHYTDETPVVFGDDGFWPVTEDDAEFVSALRNAAPALLDAAEENAGLRRALDDAQEEAAMQRVHASNVEAERDALRAEVEELRAFKATWGSVNSEMHAENERLRAALLTAARSAEALKLDCGMDPESKQAIRNGKYMAISYAARAALRPTEGEVQS